LYKDGKGFVSNSIKWLTNINHVIKLPYNHVGIYIGNGEVFEALDGGPEITKKIDVNTYAGIDVYRNKTLKLDATKKKYLKKLVKEYDVRSYDFDFIVKFAVYELSKGRISLPDKDDSVICSELALVILKLLGAKSSIDKRYVSPNDLVRDKYTFFVKRGNEDVKNLDS